LLKSLGAIPLGLSISEIANGQVTSDNQEILFKNQLIARWPFQEGFRDTVGNMDANAAYGSPTVGTYNGRSGVRFDGNDGLMVGNGNENPELSFVEQDDGPVSIGGWAYFDEETGGRQRGDYAKHHILRNDGEYVIVANPNTDNSETVGFRFRTSDLGGGSGYNTGDYTEGEMDVPIQEWHHFFFVLNPNEYIRFYLDGEIAFSDGNMDGYSPPVTNYWSHQTIGSWYGTNNPSWYNLMRGKLSDLRIYDTGLSTDEVSQIYTSTGGGSEETGTATGGGTVGTDAGENTGSSDQDDTNGTGEGTDKASDDRGVLEGVATMFQEPSENAGSWGAILGGGVLGAGYLAYRRGGSDDKKTVAKECPECGSRVEVSKAFCGNCGTRISGDGEPDTRSETETEQSVQVSDYGDLSVGEAVETGSTYQISEGKVTGSGESVWVATPLSQGEETLDSTHTQDFHDEIQPWAKMDDHPNLLSVYGHGTEPLPWLAIEPGEHPSAWDMWDELSVKEKLNISQQVCESVHHVTRYGVTYENIDASSVLLTNGTNAKLRGAVDQLEDQETSLYTAPEELDGEQTEKTLVYRIGVVSYVLLTGTLPYDGGSGSIKETIRHAEPTPPTQHASGLPDILDDTLLQALSKSPNERHETVLHLRDDLVSVSERI
jgi:hypothetical protein